MIKLSNKLLVVLVAVALTITLFGAFISINKLGYVATQYNNLLTGAATNTTTGTVTLTVGSQTAVALQVSSVAFGSGFVDPSCSGCTMDTITGYYSGNETCCTNFNNITAGFLFENQGNENVTMNFTCSGSCTAATFVNGTGPVFQFQITNSSEGASDGSASNNSADSSPDSSGSCSAGGGWNYSSWTSVDGSTNFDLCGGLGSTKYYFDTASTSDAAMMDFKVTIPSDAVTGSQKTATLTFTATSSG